MQTFSNVKEQDLKKLKKFGYFEEKPKSKLEAARMRGKVSIVLYKTGKLLIQGKKQDAKDAETLLDFLGIGKEKKGFSGSAVGTDESLKGDTFGGIVVAGFLGEDEIRDKLKEMGVKDSKDLLNPDIVRIAGSLLEAFPERCHIESLLPKEYNKLNAKEDVTGILDILHKKCFTKLAAKKKIIHIVDLYPGCSVGDIKEKKAESKYLEVAAASVLARYGALKQIRELEMKAGFFIPMGSSNVESALLELRKKSLNPSEYVKIRFKNVVNFF